MNPMNPERLATLLDAYGADPMRWPEAERLAAQDLLARSPQALALQQQAAVLDAALDACTLAAPGVALRQALLVAASLPQRPNWRDQLAGLWRELGGWRLAAPAFAFSVAVGAVLPLVLDDSAVDLPDEDLIAAVQLTDELPEWTP